MKVWLRDLAPWKAGCLGAVIAFSLMVGGLSGPWGKGHASINGGYYMLSEMRAFEVVGFDRLWGIPHLGVLPTNPPVGHPYIHHPPGWPALLFGFTRLSGLSPFGLRLLPALLTTLSVGLLVAWMTKRGFWWPLPVLLVGTMPIVGAFGSMPNPEAAVQLILVAGLFADDSRRESRSASSKFTMLLAIVGPWMDWQGAFLAPAILLRELWVTRGLRQWRFPLQIAAATAVSCAGVIAWMGLSSIHLDAIRFTILESAPNAASLTPSLSPWTWFSEGLKQVQLIGHGSAAATTSMSPLAWLLGINGNCSNMLHGSLALGIACLIFNFGHARHIVPLALPGILNIAVFRLHASQHQFWVLHLMAPGAWIAVAMFDQFLIRVEGKLTTERMGIIAGIAIALAFLGSARGLSHRDADRDGSNLRLTKALSSIQRQGVAFASTLPLGTATGGLRGYVIDIPPHRVPELVSLAARGSLIHDVDVIVPNDVDLESLRTMAPSHVRIAPVELEPGSSASTALMAWSGSRSLLRLTVLSRVP